MLFQFVLALIETILNKALQLSPQLDDALKNIQHQTLQLHITDFQKSIVITYAQEKFILLTTDEQSADCIITASIATLLELKDPAKITQLIRANKLDLTGDIRLAQAYSSALAKFDIDWAEQLSHYLGDGVSHNLTQLCKALHQKNKSLSSKLQLLAKHTLQDELNVAIHPIELTIFKTSNREIASQTEQLEIRINQLLAVAKHV